MKIFLPTIKKEYTLIQPATILLYPMNDGLNYENQRVEQYTLYGNYKNGKINYNYKRSFVRYDQSMEDDWRNNRFKDFFFVSNINDKNVQEAIKHINYPAAGILVPNAEVYVERATYVNTENKSYHVFAPHGTSEERVSYLIVEKRIFPSTEFVSTAFEAENSAREQNNANLFAETIKAGSDFSKIIQDSVPMNYLIDEGSKFKLVDIGAKKPPFGYRTKMKVPFSHIQINGEDMWILTSDLSNFDLI
jgi:hypothetical protein